MASSYGNQQTEFPTSPIRTDPHTCPAHCPHCRDQWRIRLHGSPPNTPNSHHGGSGPETIHLIILPTDATLLEMEINKMQIWNQALLNHLQSERVQLQMFTKLPMTVGVYSPLGLASKIPFPCTYTYTRPGITAFYICNISTCI